jgi:hypothetical protein
MRPGYAVVIATRQISRLMCAGQLGELRSVEAVSMEILISNDTGHATCPAITLAMKRAVASPTASGESSCRKCEPVTVTVC